MCKTAAAVTKETARLKQAFKSVLARLLPRRAKEMLFHLAFDLSPDEFQRFAFLYANAPDMRHGLVEIRERGFNPGSIIDIGAYHGDWTRMAREIWPDARILMLEANHQKRAILEATAHETGAGLEFGLLGPEAGVEMPFFVMESGSSVLEENSKLDRKVEALKTATLDGLAPEGGADLIKIDTQGFELEVLKGGPSTTAAAQAILLEVSLLQINKGAPLIAEVLGFMDALGFVSYEILEIHRRPLDRAMNQIDVLFVRRGSSLIANTAHF